MESEIFKTITIKLILTEEEGVFLKKLLKKCWNDNGTICTERDKEIMESFLRNLGGICE